ncbi:MAG: hypothetical protein ACT4P1_12945 [Sporichthyaceae bacterium]
MQTLTIPEQQSLGVEDARHGQRASHRRDRGRLVALGIAGVAAVGLVGSLALSGGSASAAAECKTATSAVMAVWAVDAASPAVAIPAACNGVSSNEAQLIFAQSMGVALQQVIAERIAQVAAVG